MTMKRNEIIDGLRRQQYVKRSPKVQHLFAKAADMLEREGPVANAHELESRVKVAEDAVNVLSQRYKDASKSASDLQRRVDDAHATIVHQASTIRKLADTLTRSVSEIEALREKQK